MVDLLKQLLKFARVHRKLWMVPAVIMLLVVAVMIVALQSATIAPFIYALF